MGNLIPCPYCKNKNVTVGGWPLEYVSCKCGVKGPDSSSRAEAIIGWNKMAGIAASYYGHHGNLVDRDCIADEIMDKWGCDPMYYASDPKCGEEARADAHVLATLAQAKIVIPAEGGRDNA